MKTKTKTTQTNKPIYSAQVEGAAGNLNSVYSDQMPKIQGYADQIGGLTGDLISRYQQGDPGVNAARDYITTTLSGDGSNPYLAQMIADTNQSVGQGVATHMGTRGLSGGSVAAKIMARELAKNETGLRYADHNNVENRKMQAAGMAPGMSAAQYIPLAPAMSAAGFGASLPMDAALKNAAGIGGLLGQYQNVNGTQTQSGGLGQMLGGILGAGLGGWATGGFKF